MQVLQLLQVQVRRQWSESITYFLVIWYTSKSPFKPDAAIGILQDLVAVLASQLEMKC